MSSCYKRNYTNNNFNRIIFLPESYPHPYISLSHSLFLKIILNNAIKYSFKSNQNNLKLNKPLLSSKSHRFINLLCYTMSKRLIFNYPEFRFARSLHVFAGVRNPPVRHECRTLSFFPFGLAFFKTLKHLTKYIFQKRHWEKNAFKFIV